MLRPIVFLIVLSFSSAMSAREPGLPFEVESVATFNEPWAMTFLPDGRMLVTEKRGRLYLVTQQGEKSRPVEEVPDVDYRGQGGLGDVILHPDFADNGLIYISYAETGIGNVSLGFAQRLVDAARSAFAPSTSGVAVVWNVPRASTSTGSPGRRA